MAKKISIIITALICLLLLASCGCEHVWIDATCEAPKTCSECGATEGENAEHQWIDATCDKPKTCSVCGEFSGFSAGHVLDETTCTIFCTVCGYIDPASVEHEWMGPTCVAPKFCFNCGFEESPPLGHVWNEASCLEPRQCSVCFEIDETAGSNHAWIDDGCTKRCEVCDLVDFSTKPHTLSDDSDGVSGVCTVCDKKIEYFVNEDVLYAVTEYSNNPSETVTYIKSKTSEAAAVVVNWFEGGTLSGCSTDTFVGGIDASAFYVNGEIYYYVKYEAADEETVNELMNAAANYISFSSAIYDELNYAHATLVGPGGFEGDNRGEAYAAVDVYGNQFCIAHQNSGASSWAIPCNWMK